MDTDQTNLVVIPGLENSQPVTLTPLQVAMKPYVPVFEIFWWCVWVGVLLYVAVRFVIQPLMRRR